MIILGIDPGTATTGYGIIKLNKNTKGLYEILDFGVISTSKTDTDAARLAIIVEDIATLLKTYKPKLVGIEKLFFATNQKTAITVSQARGAVLATIAGSDIPIVEFTPLQVKNTICGYGKAEKKQVQFMVKQAFNLKSIPKPDDAADALAIALCAALHNSKRHDNN